MTALKCGSSIDWCRRVSLLVAFFTTSLTAATNFATGFGGSGQDYAAAVASDSSGNTYVAGLTYSPDLHVTSGAFQPIIGGNGTIANPSSIASDAFIAKFSPSGTLVWATFLGGSGDDYATGIGVDGNGNVLVTGWTRSGDFPVLKAAQPTLNSGVSPYRWDAFVTKVDPTGSKLIYSTYLGGPDDDGAYGLAVDAVGNAYITGQATVAAGFTGFGSSASGDGMFVSKFDPAGGLVYSFFNPNVSFAALPAAGIAVDSSGSAYVTGTVSAAFPVTTASSFGPQGSSRALVFKLSPDGSRIVYQTSLGGSVDANGLAIAVDVAGAAYVGGLTNSIDYPLVNPVQSLLGARPLWKSTDSGKSWKPLDGLPFAFLQTVAVDPTASATIYAGTSDLGVFKSIDGGNSWASINGRINGKVIQVLAIDPAQPQILYAATGSGVTPGAVYRTMNGGINWSMIDSSTTGEAVQIAIDAQSPDTLYVVWNNQGTRKSVDAGATWSSLPFSGNVDRLPCARSTRQRQYLCLFRSYYSGETAAARHSPVNLAQQRRWGHLDPDLQPVAGGSGLDR